MSSGESTQIGKKLEITQRPPEITPDPNYSLNLGPDRLTNIWNSESACLAVGALERREAKDEKCWIESI